MLDSAATKAGSKDKSLLKQWSKKLNNAENQESAVLLALSDEVTEVMGRYRDKSLVTIHDKIFKIEAERKKSVVQFLV